MAAYSMPFHMRDVLGSYPSAQLAAVDRDTQIFRYGQIFQNTKNPNKRLVAARTLAGISPGYQEARIEQLAGDNFSQRAFQAEQREAMALQKKYIQDRSEYMEQKTNNRLLRGSVVEALARGGRATGDRTPFADLDLDENFDIAGRGSMASGLSTPGSSISQRMERPALGESFFVPMNATSLREALAAGEAGGLSDEYWSSSRGSSVSGISSLADRSTVAGSELSDATDRSWRTNESSYGLGVEPVNVNLDPTYLQNIQQMRAASSEERARMEVVGSLVGEMVSGVAGYEAFQQEQERQAGVRQLMYEAGIMDVQNPADMTEADLRIVARANEEARRRGFFGRAEMAADETFLEQPLEIESAEMGMEPGGRSLQEVLGTVDEFGSRGSLALASGGVAVRRGRPRESEEAKAERRAIIRQAEEATGVRGLSIAEARQVVAGEFPRRVMESMYPEAAANLYRGMAPPQPKSKKKQPPVRLEGGAAEARIARLPTASTSAAAIRKSAALPKSDPQSEEFTFSLFD